MNAGGVMKKFLMIVLMLAFAVAANAQEYARSSLIGMGLKAGINFGSFIGSEAGSPGTRVGFSGGGFLTYKVARGFSIQPELYFTMKGGKRSPDTSNQESWDLNYLEIPLLLKFNFPTEGTVKPSIFAGPQLGFPLSASFNEQDVMDYVKGTEFSLAFGAGLEYKLRTVSLTFDARYVLGLTRIISATDFNTYYGLSPTDQGYLAADPKLRTSNIVIMAGVNFL
jgi:opacity protein-like surface antigen